SFRKGPGITLVLGLGTYLADEISEKGDNRRGARQRRNLEEWSQLRVDVAGVVGPLSASLRDLAERFLQGQSISEIARETHVSRRKLKNRARHLRLLFEKAGLRDYI